MWYPHGDWGWEAMLFGGLMMILFWGGLILLAVWLFRSQGGRTSGEARIVRTRTTTARRAARWTSSRNATRGGRSAKRNTRRCGTISETKG